jgi:Zn-finger nucleic acid-binding protein
MRNYERNQVHVDQCTGCGGLFLDRGELEALVAAENAWHQAPVQQPPAAPAARQQPAQIYQAPYGNQYGQQYGQGHRRKKSFLSELFD